MDRMVKSIQLTWKLALMLKTYNSTVKFSKYELYNKLLGGVTLFRVILGVTWTQPIYIYRTKWQNTHFSQTFQQNAYIYMGQNSKIPISHKLSSKMHPVKNYLGIHFCLETQFSKNRVSNA